MRHRQHHVRFWYSDGLGRPSSEMVSGKDLRFDLGAVDRFFLGDLPPRLVDLMRIAVAVYATDRRALRGPEWSRDLTIRVEVFDPVYWNGSEVLLDLRSAVELISGDCWEFEFVKTATPYEGAGRLVPPIFAGESPLVCLYSGGLDSTAGLASRLLGDAKPPILPVTVVHQPRQLGLVSGQYGRFSDKFGVKFHPLTVRAALIRASGSRRSHEESSQRARSFLFAALGAVAAIQSSAEAVEVYESGVGAINVPLRAGMSGAKATRGCLPGFFRLMSRLTSMLADREIHFRLPFDRMTKGEMVLDLARTGLADLARRTISCASYPLGYRPGHQCGICAACVYRRQAMIVAGIVEPDGQYAFNIFGDASEVNEIAPDKLKYLKAFCLQVASWRGIEEAGRLRGPVELHLRETKTLSFDESSERIVHLLARNRDEWMAIAAEGRRRGYRWAEWLNPNARDDGRGASRDAA